MVDAEVPFATTDVGLALTVELPAFGVPAVTVMLVLTADVREPSVAVNVYVPTLLMMHPPNVATPAEAALLSPPVHVSVAPPGVVSASEIVEVSVVTGSPPASSTVTAGD
jgi:hypothetical protein